MDALHAVARVLERAESDTRAQLAKVAEAGSYEIVVPILDIAQKLALMRANLVGLSPLSSPDPDNRNTLGRATAGPQGHPQSVTATSYPLFRRDGDSLVKVGWSKKAKQTYEHRTPKKILLHVASILRGKSAFNMQKLLPCRNYDGTDVPSYQAYMVVAWLSSVGAVKRDRRGDYRTIASAMSESAIDGAWDATPERTEPEE
jgi:hypothetical protein